MALDAVADRFVHCRLSLCSEAEEDNRGCHESYEAHQQRQKKEKRRGEESGGGDESEARGETKAAEQSTAALHSRVNRGLGEGPPPDGKTVRRGRQRIFPASLGRIDGPAREAHRRQFHMHGRGVNLLRASADRFVAGGVLGGFDTQSSREG